VDATLGFPRGDDDDLEDFDEDGNPREIKAGLFGNVSAMPSKIYDVSAIQRS